MKSGVIKTGALVKTENREIVYTDQKKIKTFEEKQTDVSIAVKIVEDAYTSAGKDFSISCLISNDSDLGYALSVATSI